MSPSYFTFSLERFFGFRFTESFDSPPGVRIPAVPPPIFVINVIDLKGRRETRLGDIMVKIGSLKARRIFDSRGNPTIEIDLIAVDEAGKIVGSGRAAAPSGASTGIHEVTAFPEKGGVDTSLAKVAELSEELVGMDLEQGVIDQFCKSFDGTSSLSNVGGNAIVAISMAVAKTIASVAGEPVYKNVGGNGAVALPFPLGNMIGGGAHAGGAAPDIQEFLALPVGAPSFNAAVTANMAVHKMVKKLVAKFDKNFTGGKGDEGAWAPNVDNRQALDILSSACEKISDEMGFRVGACLDVASCSLYDEKTKKYSYAKEGVKRDDGEQVDYIIDLVKTFNLAYVEDPVFEENFEDFAEITAKVGGECLICGDDLYVTNVERINRGIEAKSTNAVLIKPNQIGCLTDTRAAVDLTKSQGWVPVISHRSGETPDETIANLAVGYGCPVIKTGAVGGERIAKLNELLRIEEQLGDRARMGELPWK